MITTLLVLVLLLLMVSIIDLWMSFRVKKRLSQQYYNVHGEHHWLVDELEKVKEQKEARLDRLDSMIDKLEEIVKVIK